MSNNILDMAPYLTRTGLNLLIAIISAVQKNIIMNPDSICENYPEMRIEIPRQYLSRRHTADDISPELKYLLSFSFTFRRAIPGYYQQGITRLISSIVYDRHCIIVAVPGDTIPWLLYCGQAVNFTMVEKEVIFRLQSLSEQLLYLFLMSRTRKDAPRSYISIPVENLYTVMGLKDTRPIGSILQKNIKKFSNHLQDSGSRYIVNYTMRREPKYTGRPGPRPYTDIDFVVENTLVHPAEGDLLAAAAENVAKIIFKYAHNHPHISVPFLVSEIEKKGKEDEFIEKMNRLSLKNEKEENYYKLANTIVKILPTDFGINI